MMSQESFYGSKDCDPGMLSSAGLPVARFLEKGFNQLTWKKNTRTGNQFLDSDCYVTVVVTHSNMKIHAFRVQFSHVSVLSDSCNMQKKCDTNHIPLASGHCLVALRVTPSQWLPLPLPRQQWRDSQMSSVPSKRQKDGVDTLAYKIFSAILNSPKNRTLTIAFDYLTLILLKHAHERNWLFPCNGFNYPKIMSLDWAVVTMVPIALWRFMQVTNWFWDFCFRSQDSVLWNSALTDDFICPHSNSGWGPLFALEIRG